MTLRAFIAIGVVAMSADVDSTRLSAPVRIVVTSAIVEDQVWTNDVIWELEGPITVMSGSTLTIEPGTRIEAQRFSISGGGGALFVQRDGILVAEGTPLEPIVFTCADGPTPRFKGCWRGLVLNGNAPLNEGSATSPSIPGRAPGGCLEKIGEGSSGNYGGCNPTDSSGVVRYVRIEYAGFTPPNHEVAGLALQGVGSGTVVDHIQVHAGLDDGIEIFGGTARLSHVLITAASDDSFDWVEGWNGKVQHMIIQQDSLDANDGIEGDNTNTAFEAQPRSRPQLWNVTIVGKADPQSTGGPDPVNNGEGGLLIRRGTRPTLRNFMVLSHVDALDVDDAPTCVSDSQGAFSFAYSIFVGNSQLNDGDAESPPCKSEEQFLQEQPGNQFLTTSPLLAPFDVVTPDFRPAFGSASGGATPPSDGFFDVTATYVGAVPPANAMRSNIPWYAGWTRAWASPTTP